MATTTLKVPGLRSTQAAALRRKAGKLGVTPEAYVRQLIESDLKLDKIASETSFADLAKPFTATLADVPPKQLDDLAKSATKASPRKPKR